jgi:glycine/D-amino acid oxidase-like deaminating enzyme
MRVLIAGGGAIGAAVAYFLALRGVEAVVVESTGVANAASGKAGGFLASDWSDGTPLGLLARRSFALHARLAEEIGADWGFRRMTAYAGVVGAGRGRGDGWLSAQVRIGQRLGTPETTAQVHPALFTQAMLRAALAHGATLREGRVGAIVQSADRTRVEGVEIDGDFIAADAVVVALGPWSALARQWLPFPAVYGLKGHSLVFETGEAIPAEALFLDYRAAGRAALTPEIFPRPDGTVWACAISSETPLPLDPAAVAPDEGAMERLETLCRGLSPLLAEAPILARQACYRPMTRDGLPLIGRLPGPSNAYAATGHSVWGILNAPATGEAMAELLVDGEASEVDLGAFDPGRFWRG